MRVSVPDVNPSGKHDEALRLPASKARVEADHLKCGRIMIDGDERRCRYGRGPPLPPVPSVSLREGRPSC